MDTNRYYRIDKDGNIGEYIPPILISEIQNGLFLDKTTKARDVNGNILYIPADFKVIEDGPTTIDEGIVIEDRNGNQFVWVPVPNVIFKENKGNIISSTEFETINKFSYTPMAKVQKGSSTNYSAILYDFSEDKAKYMSEWDLGKTQYREPSLITKNSNDTYAILESVSGTEYDAKSEYYNTILGYESAIKFGEGLQNEYNDMVNSVNKYKRFYVARYETLFSGKTVRSIAGPGNYKMSWYDLYNYSSSKNENNPFYTSNSVNSTMIWGSQYDAMMLWMAKCGVKVGLKDETKYNTSIYIGKSPTDVINNIYDLYGCHLEFTIEAHNTSGRTIRGGGYSVNNKRAPSSRDNYAYYFTPTELDAYDISRLTIYIKLDAY